MKLLIVEDDASLAEITAELLKSVDQNTHFFEAITLAADLETAIHSLPEHDTVLCDGTFPLSPDSTFVVDDWDVVRQEALRRGIYFVLYSGSICALESARESNTPALTKPAAIEDIYAALTCERLTLRSCAPTERVALRTNVALPEKIMIKTLDEVCLDLETKAAALGQHAEMDARADHLRAVRVNHLVHRLPVQVVLLGYVGRERLARLGDCGRRGRLRCAPVLVVLTLVVTRLGSSLLVWLVV